MAIPDALGGAAVRISPAPAHEAPHAPRPEDTVAKAVVRSTPSARDASRARLARAREHLLALRDQVGEQVDLVEPRSIQARSEPVQVSGDDGSGLGPSMVEHDGDLHLVWTHAPTDTRIGYIPNRDIHDSTRAASGDDWSDPANVTGLYESALERDGVAPSIAVSSEGEIVVAHESGHRDLFMDLLLNTAGRVIQVQDDAAAGPPVEVVPPTFEGCYTNRPRSAADGSLHVLSICDEGEGETLLFHAVRTGDEWAEASRVKAKPRGERDRASRR